MARTMATASSRGPYRVGDESRLAFRCLPIDIDFNLHLNNARYMMLADLAHDPEIGIDFGKDHAPLKVLQRPLRIQ
jgi:acyl-ACP thioesterase